MVDSDRSQIVTGRRRVVAGLAATSLTGVVGCSTVTGSITTLEAETEHHNRRTDVLFTDGEDVRFTLSLRRDHTRDDPRRYYPFRIVTANPDLELNSFELVFRASSGPVRALHLRELREQKADVVEFYNDGGQTVLAMPNPGQVPVFAESSHQFELVLASPDSTAQTLSIDIDVSLSNGAAFEDEYIARSQLDVEFP